MVEQLAEERHLVQTGQPGTGTLVSNLVRAGEAANSAKGGALKPLSESEILVTFSFLISQGTIRRQYPRHLPCFFSLLTLKCRLGCPRRYVSICLSPIHRPGLIAKPSQT